MPVAVANGQSGLQDRPHRTSQLGVPDEARIPRVQHPILRDAQGQDGRQRAMGFHHVFTPSLSRETGDRSPTFTPFDLSFFSISLSLSLSLFKLLLFSECSCPMVLGTCDVWISDESNTDNLSLQPIPRRRTGGRNETFVPSVKTRCK